MELLLRLSCPNFANCTRLSSGKNDFQAYARMRSSSKGQKPRTSSILKVSQAARSYSQLIDLSLAIRTNPEDFFLALRLFRAIVFRGEVLCNQFENLLGNLADVIMASPQDFVREELVKIVKAWICRIANGHTIHFGCGSGAYSDRKLSVHKFCVQLGRNS